MTSGIPTLQTKRLVLRAHEASDFEAFARMWSDAEVVRYIGGKPSSEEDSWGRFLKYLGQ